MERSHQTILDLAAQRGLLRPRDLTTQSSFEVWLAIPNKVRAPKMDYPPLRIVRFSGSPR